MPDTANPHKSDGTARLFLFTLLLAAAGLAAGQTLLFRYGVPRIISDGSGYWSYLPSCIILGDPTFKEFMARHAGTPQAQGVLPTPDGRYFQKYPVGVAILQAPFFLAADAVARRFHFTRDGYSPPYQAAAAISAGTYALAGLALLLAALRPYYPPAGLALAGLFLLFGTNAYQYATFDGSFSHVFSFFLGAALVYVLLARQRTDLSLVLWGGGILGLMLLVRPTNSLYFLFAACWLGLGRYRALGRAGLRSAATALAGMGIIAAAIFCIQLAVWQAATGKWFLYSYEGEHFDFASPHLSNVLFSVRKGLFFWNPLFLAAMIGLFLTSRPRGYRPAAAVFLAASIYVTSSWYCWWYGGTLGQRAFVDTLPVLFAGLANLTVLKSRAARIAAIGLCVLFTLHALWCTWFYWLGVIPGDGANLGHLGLAWRITRAWLAGH